ncbi:MAG: 50S ribosomal protein L44e [Candidatus Aenigmatarchaeota archaeon]
MKIPKIQKRFCPHCKMHTEQEVRRVGSGKKRREMAIGQRRFNRKMKGYGSFPKSNPKDRAKPVKKVDLRYECKKCKRQNTIGLGYRAGKFEMVKRAGT